MKFEDNQKNSNLSNHVVKKTLFLSGDYLYLKNLHYICKLKIVGTRESACLAVYLLFLFRNVRSAAAYPSIE